MIEKEGLCDRANEVGARIRAGLGDLQARHPQRIGDIRGRGAMIAMELVRDGDPAKPDADLTKALVAEAAERGLLLLSCGVRGNVIRILTPLTIPFEHLEEGLGLLAEAFEACAG